MEYYKIGKFQAICMVFIVMLNHIILNLPKNVFLKSGNSALLNTVYIIILMMFFLYFIVKAFRRFEGKDILDISNFLGGKKLKIVMGICFLVFFLFIGGLTLRNFLEGLKEIYFPNTPIYVLMILVLLVALIANKFSGGTVIKFNSIIAPLMAVNLLIVLLSTSPSYVPEKIFPLFGYGLNETFGSGLTNIYAFSGISFLYFMMPLLKDPKEFTKIGFISIAISSIFLFLSILTLLFSFSSVITMYELSPIYLVLRSADFGRFFQRPDALFILGWILGIIAYISLILLVCCISFQKMTNIKNSKMMTYAFSTFLLIVGLIPSNLAQIRTLQQIIYEPLILALTFVITPIILLLANIKHKRLHPNAPPEVNLDHETSN